MPEKTDARKFALIGKPAPIVEQEPEPVSDPDANAVIPYTWHPTSQEKQLITQLAELGWPAVEIAEKFGISIEEFAGCDDSRQAFDKGTESHKSLPERRTKWRPDPGALYWVTEYASKGYLEPIIAGKLGVARDVFALRMRDTPQLREAFEAGNAKYQQKLIDKANTLLEQESSTLKFLATELIFQRKAYCGMSDKPETVKVEPVQVNVAHTHTLKVPDPVPVKDLAAYAVAEMERARKISAEKLAVAQEAKARQDALDSGEGEVIDIEASVATEASDV